MDYVKALADLIAIDTSVPPGRNYDRAVEYLQPLFNRVGFETEKVDIPSEHAGGEEGRVALVAHRRDAGKPRLLIYGHVDVVPAEGWDAFNPRVENGRIYGRGAADMKGAIVALLLGLETLAGSPLKYDVSVMITTDEEVGQAGQLRYLARYLQPLSGAHILSLDASFGHVAVASLGVLQMDVKVQGRSVHSGLSHLGENAVEKAIPLTQALLALKEEVARRESRVEVHPDTGLEHMVARLNINMMRGGIKVNVVPDECLVTIDRRLIPEENLEDARRELVGVLSAVPQVKWEVDSVFAIPTVPPCEGPIVDELARTIEEVTGTSGKFGEMGSGDLPHIAEEWGAREFGLGVIRSECNIHGKGEFVYQRDIEDLAEIIARFVRAAA